MTINVVIPVYNQSFALAQTLYGFSQQVEPYNACRIIVVDDGSSEPIEAVVASYADTLNITYIRLSRSGRAAARNVGIQAAESDVIVFCDADRIPRPNFLQMHDQAQQSSGGSVAVGHVKEMYVSRPEANRSVILERFMMDRLLRLPQYCSLIYGLFNADGLTTSPIAWVATLSGNLSLPTHWCRALGGFDERFMEWGFEHMEFGFRAYHEEMPFRYEARAVNVHIAHPRDGRSYESLIRNSHAYFIEKHPCDAVRFFLPFMVGKISLRQFERQVDASTAGQEPDGFVRITNSIA